MTKGLVFIGLSVIFVTLPASAASLRADRSSQLIQNERADQDHLSRMEDLSMTQRWVRLELLEPIDEQTSHYYLHAVPDKNRYLRPWAKLFLMRLSRQFHARFRQPMRVTSLLRTADYQEALARRNGNAAAADGPKRSAHLTGACLDISKKGMSAAQQRWVRDVLSSLRTKGYLYAIEEYQQPVFHIMIHRNYEDYVDHLLAEK